MNKFVFGLGHQVSRAVGEVDPQVNKFEQVSNFGHQVSLPGDGVREVPVHRGIGARDRLWRGSMHHG